MEEPGIADDISMWLTDSGLRIGLIILGFYIAHRFGGLIIHQVIKQAIANHRFPSETDRKKRAKTITGLLTASLSVVLWILALILIIQELGINVGPLVAGVSVVGVAVGFGAQSLVKDFLSGFFIILENQYRVGDVVEIAGVQGKVEAITMRTTVLRNLDGNIHNIPNSLVQVSTNLTMDFANINLSFPVSYDSDLEKVEKLINKVGSDMAADSTWQHDIVEAPSYVRVESFGPNEISLKINGKVQAGSQWRVAGELRLRLKQAFEKAHITTAYQSKDKSSPKSRSKPPKS